VAKLGDDVKYFHIMGCSLMAKREFGLEILKLMKKLVERDVKISFDPNIRPELMKDESINQMVQEVMSCCSIFLPGVSELLLISGKETVEDSVKTCFLNPKLEVLVLKNGSEGCTVYTREESISIGVYPTNVKDPTGAGDCFDGAFICGLLEGKDLLYSAKMASAAASLNTAALGPMEGNISRSTVEEITAGQSLS